MEKPCPDFDIFVFYCLTNLVTWCGFDRNPPNVNLSTLCPLVLLHCQLPFARPRRIVPEPGALAVPAGSAARTVRGTGAFKTDVGFT